MMSEETGATGNRHFGAEKNQFRALYGQLMDINHDTFESGYYDIAYHTLAAALSWAEAEGTRDDLATIERTASEQLAFIDQHAPSYHHSTASAAERGHVSIFATLAKQAHARLLIMQHASK